MAVSVLGIDTGNVRIEAVLYHQGTYSAVMLPNKTQSIALLLNWMASKQVQRVHACLLSSSTSSEPIATALIAAHHIVSIVHPASVTAFDSLGIDAGSRRKIDATLLARYCASQRPLPWQPAAKEVTELIGLVSWLYTLEETRQSTLKQLAAGIAAQSVADAIVAHLHSLEHEIKNVKSHIQNLIKKYPDLQNQHDLMASLESVDQDALLYTGEKFNTLRISA